MSEGIVYHHFGSKLGLLGAVAASYGNGIAQVMAQQQDLSQPLQVDRMIRAVFDYVEEHELLLTPDGPGDLKAVMHAHHEHRHRGGADVRACRVNADGVFRAWTLWPPLAAAMISGLFISTLLTLGVVPALYRLLFREPA